MLTRKTNRIREIDGLRAISVLLVVIGHCITHIYSENTLVYKVWWNFGSSGVLIFFVISGYIITKLFIHEKESYGSISITNFCLRRIFRIIPVFYFYLLVIYVLVVMGILDVPIQNIFMSGMFLANLNLIENIEWYIGHSWSLATEEQFYIFFPFVFLFIKIYLGRIGFFFLWIFFYCVWGILQFKNQIVLASLFYYLLWIMAGVVISVYEQKLKPLVDKCGALFLIILAFLLVIWPLVNLAHQARFQIPFSCFALGLLLMKSIYSSGFWAKFLNNAIIQWVGTCSYSIYLWQELFTNSPSLIWTPVGIVACAAFSYYIIEKPCNSFGRRFVSNRLQNSIVRVC